LHAAIISQGSGANLRYGYGTTAGGLDANTTHLWRLDESSVPFADSTTVVATAIPLQFMGTGVNQVVSVLQAPGGEPNNGRQIDTNFASSANQNIIRAFAQASDASDNMTAAQYNSFFGASGAFTLDFLMRADFGGAPTTEVRIISGEGSDGSEPNLFSLLWLTSNKLQLTASPGGVEADIPTTGAHALAASSWYHVAFAYDGNEGVAGNLKFYWTLVDGPETALAAATTEANLAGSYTFASDPMTVSSDPGPEWSIGNRPAGGRSFDGQLDEIRISNVARGAGEFIFVPEPSSFTLLGLVVFAFIGSARRNRFSSNV
jgi:hypothetical protein